MLTNDKIIDYLEDESIEIIREVANSFSRSVVLFSIGKDSIVLLDLVKKAFFPANIPFKILHVDTTWKFRSMITFRDKIFMEYPNKTIIKINNEGVQKEVNPFDYSPGEYTRIMKTVPLKIVLDEYEFECAIGGSRRDEEKSRAKERIFSIREEGHIWNPRKQRPELWNTYNLKVKNNQTFRAFPLSNWTEIDVWKYILRNNLQVPDLYFSKIRDCVVRENNIFVIDDDRFRLGENEKIYQLNVRFRSLGCYPLTAAFESTAKNVKDIIKELESTNISERNSRLIDGEKDESMEHKKREGYF